MMKKDKAAAGRAVPRFPVGIDLLHDPRLNKGTAFTDAERDLLRLRGLLPPRVFTERQQLERILENFNRKKSDLERYIFMAGLQDRNERLFYRTVIDNIGSMMPVIYTPTVGEACRLFGHIFRRPRGLYVSAKDKGHIRDVLRNWPERDVAIIVVTDGERILGLGDLGAYGMGIPIGKLALYTACAGIDPAKCLPVQLDVGTNNEQLLADPLYIGLLQHRLRGDAYDDLVDEFVMSVQEVFKGTILQFEDFATENAMHLLAKYRDVVCSFNDDIQGTAGVTLAGLLSAAQLTRVRLRDQRILFFGAGSAATGIADLTSSAMVREGLTEREARERCWFFDSKGLVVASRTDLASYKRPYAHQHEFVRELLAAVKSIRPTTLIGVSAQPQTFTEPILREMAAINERPIVFALSNPTTKCECTAEQAYRWTEGRAVFVTGSPFDPVEYNGRTIVTGQGNNAYVFPGVGLGVHVSGARRVTDTMFAAAARTLAACVGKDMLEQGSIYPPLSVIREVSAAVAAAVARVARDEGLATKKLPDDVLEHVKAAMYNPDYVDYQQFVEVPARRRKLVVTS